MARYASGQNQPITHWNNLPVYLTTILTAVFVVVIILLAVASAAGIPLAAWLMFPMPLLPAWSVWRAITYVTVQPINFFTPFSLLCFYWWGVGIESHMGRSVLSKLLLLLALSGAAVGALFWWGFGASTLTVGNYAFTAGLMIAFATLYPNAEAWGWIPFKWLAFACLVCGSLMLLASRSWTELWQLWVASGVAFAYVRHAKELEFDDYESPLSRIKFWFQSRKFKVVRPSESGNFRTESSNDSTEMDRLLDKIAKSGMASLTASERHQLEKEREAILRKEKR